MEEQVNRVYGDVQSRVQLTNYIPLLKHQIRGDSRIKASGGLSTQLQCHAYSAL